MSDHSEVYSATSNTLFSKKNTPSKTHALTLEWVYGRTPCLPVLMLQAQDQQVLLYAAANVGVIYNHTSNSQHLLQGHSRDLCALCVSEDKRWIATADPSPMVLVWDSYSGIPVCTLLDCHPKDGFTDLAFSKDVKLLVTLGMGPAQHVCIWDWTNNTEKPLCCTDINPTHGLQSHILFNSSGSALLSCSRSHVLLYTVEQCNLSYVAQRLFKSEAEEPGSSHSKCAADAALVQTAFHWSKTQVLTATRGGSVVVWDMSVTVPKREVFLHHLQGAAFTVMTVIDSYMVTGDAEGTVKFFGDNFLLLAFYSYDNVDPVSSISFSSEPTAGLMKESPVSKEQLFSRNFAVSLVGPLVLHVSAETGTFQTLLDEESEPIQAVCCHPTHSLLVTGNNQGLLKLRDTASKKTLSYRKFGSKEEITCVTYDPQGVLLAVGFSCGSVHLLDSSLCSVPQDGFSFSRHSIQLLIFSSDALYLAAADSGFAVTVFQRVSDGAHWQSIGRHRSHFAPVQSLLFGFQPDSPQPRLLSLGRDRRLVEYDLVVRNGSSLSVLSTERVEQRAVPLGMSWYPPLSTEQFILICTEQYKLRLINSATKMSRKLIRSPAYGSPIQRIQVLPQSKSDPNLKYYMAFTTHDKVGVQILPADGNPFKSQALIAHPSGVKALSTAFDGRHVVTAGDFSVMSWSINTNALEAAAALGGAHMEPFYTLLDGGRHGHIFREIEDFFIYIQIPHKGTLTKKREKLFTTIPLSEVSSLMRAIGYFPTEKEIEDMMNEVKFSKYADTGQYVTELDLEDFIKLYLNHRSESTEEDMEQAFTILRAVQPPVEKEFLLELLQSYGETMTEDEVSQSFSFLLNLREEHSENSSPPIDINSVVPANLSLETLAEMLGFSTKSKGPSKE